MSESSTVLGRMESYYSFLFTFPPRRTTILFSALVLCLASGLFVSFLSPVSLWNGLLLIIFTMGAPLFFAEFVIVTIFGKNIIFKPRRFSIQTFVSCIVYTAVIILSSAISLIFDSFTPVLKGVALAAGITVGLRLLSLRSLTAKKVIESYFAAILPSFLSLLGLIFFSSDDYFLLTYGFVTILAYVVGVELLIWRMNCWKGDVNLLSLFRAFILAWTEEINDPLEDEISQLGEERDLIVDCVFFMGKKGDYLGSFIIPHIHPGPFRNVGGSALPTILSETIGNALGCEVLVAHGFSSHDKDLTRHDYNSLIAEKILSYLPTKTSSHISPMIWAERGNAKASCQMIGDVALITLTLAPLSYDDLPEKVAEEIEKWATINGKRAIVVDSHNSIDLKRGFDHYEFKDLVAVAKEAVKSAVELEQQRFEIASARIIPKEWGLKEGMGQSGISSLVLKLGEGARVAYIEVDGNNMVSGLREKVIDAIKERGYEGVEVMTSDTHTVNAIGVSEQGYSPVGEKMNFSRFIKYTLETIDEAEKRLEPCNVMSSRITIPRLTILGTDGLNRLRHILESGFDLFKKTGIALGIGCLLFSLLLASIF